MSCNNTNIPLPPCFSPSKGNLWPHPVCEDPRWEKVRLILEGVEEKSHALGLKLLQTQFGLLEDDAKQVLLWVGLTQEYPFRTILMEDDGMYGTSQMGETYTGLKVYLRLKIPVNKKYLDLDSFKAQVVEVSSWNSEMIVSPIWYRNVWKLSVEFDGKAKVKFYDGYKTVPTVGYIKGSAEMGRDQVLRRLLYLGR